MTPLMPEDRRAEVSRLAIRSLPAGILSTCITAALVGLLTAF
jgi:nucleoside permease NupC